MNGPGGMYKIAPYFDYSKTQIELPTCMFKMQNIHENISGSTSVPNDANQEDQSIAALEHRQENILQELKALESEVATLAVKFKSQEGATTAVASGNQKTKRKTPGAASQPASKLKINGHVPSPNLGNVIHDMVISANPSNPPLSLFVLYHTLSTQYRCRTKVHIHSSVKNVPDKLWHCFGNNGVEVPRHGADIGITLIWKDVPYGPELKVSAQSQTPIQGEANIARYLARLIKPRYEYAPYQHVGAVDDLLDLASHNIMCGSSKEKAAAVRSLNSTLGKNEWLSPSGDITVADAVVWSALHQTGLIKGAPGNVTKWLKACEAQKAYQCTLACL